MKLRVLNGWRAGLSAALGLSGSVFLAWFAFRKLSDHFLFHAAVALSVVVAASLLALLLRLFLLWRALPRHAWQPEPFVRGEPRRLDGFGFSHRRFGLRMEEWRNPAAAIHGDETLFQRRGLFKQFSVVWTAADPLGVVAVRLEWTRPARLTVEPSKAKPTGPPLEDHAASGDEEDSPTGRAEGDLTDVENWRPGETMQRFMWRTYFRTQGRVKMVRKAATTAARTRSYLFLPSSDDEHGASLARLLVEGHLDPGSWWLFVPGNPARGLLRPEEKKEALAALAESGGLAEEDQLAVEVRRFAELSSVGFVASGGVVILTAQPAGDLEMTKWRASLLEARQALSGRSLTLLVALRRGQVLDAPSIDGEFGLARGIEIEDLSNPAPGLAR